MSMRYMSAALGAVVLGLLLAGTIDAAPYQELEPRDGYVPVYIREGDTPLLEINPKLAEAFNEIDTKNLLEVDDETDVEKKPDLILMSIDNDGEAMLIAKPADQVMSENEPAEVLAIEPAPVSESEDESDLADIAPENPTDNEEASKHTEDTANVDQPEEGEAPKGETNSQQLEEAKEAIKELVNVLEVEMLKKLSLAVTEKPVAAEEKIVEEDDEPVVAPVDSSNDDDLVIVQDDKPEEPATDVLSVDDFKTKEIDVKSVETEKIDVPEEDTPEDTVSKDE